MKEKIKNYIILFFIICLMLALVVFTSTYIKTSQIIIKTDGEREFSNRLMVYWYPLTLLLQKFNQPCVYDFLYSGEFNAPYQINQEIESALENSENGLFEGGNGIRMVQGLIFQHSSYYYVLNFRKDGLINSLSLKFENGLLIKKLIVTK